MYSIDRYREEIETIKASGTQVEVIGKSTLGEDIYMITKGNMSHIDILVVGTMHAREYIVTPLLLELIKEYEGRVGIACIPLVNVDGMRLCIEGLECIKDVSRREMLYRINGGSQDFSRWKANANAVDLNVNFNAKWGMGKSNVDHPSSENYIGKYPLSEVENQILAGVTLKLQPKILLSYHTKGEVVYHGYEGNLAHIHVAQSIANYINYHLEESKGSYGGYKDWFMATTPYLGLTIECGSDSLTHPLPMSELPSLIRRHRGLFDEVARLVDEIE